jgi:hypothetical protein
MMEAEPYQETGHTMFLLERIEKFAEKIGGLTRTSSLIKRTS